MTALSATAYIKNQSRVNDRNGVFLFRIKKNVIYFSKGFVEVSLAGIGKNSTCPGFGSAFKVGK